MDLIKTIDIKFEFQFTWKLNCFLNCSYALNRDLKLGKQLFEKYGDLFYKLKKDGLKVSDVIKGNKDILEIELLKLEHMKNENEKNIPVINSVPSTNDQNIPVINSVPSTNDQNIPVINNVPET